MLNHVTTVYLLLFGKVLLLKQKKKCTAFVYQKNLLQTLLMHTKKLKKIYSWIKIESEKNSSIYAHWKMTSAVVCFGLALLLSFMLDFPFGRKWIVLTQTISK